jgi:hypothetical protein
LSGNDGTAEPELEPFLEILPEAGGNYVRVVSEKRKSASID